MDATSQVILRNEARLAGDSVLVVNPPRDQLAKSLQGHGRPVRLSTQDFGDFRWLEAAGFDVTFEAVPALTGDEATIVLNLPREKGRLVMLLQAVAAGLHAGARLWLVGENRAGIRSSVRLLEAEFGRVTVLDKARHCGLLEAREPLRKAPFDLADYLSPWSLTLGGRELRLLSLPGVFAHGRLDRGSALLLETLRPLRPAGRVLDFACGAGVIGLSLMQDAGGLDLTLLDSSALALESCRRSMAANGIEANLLASDGLAEVSGRFDWIISNPPFHRGIRNDLGIAAGFFRRAGTFLAENGRIVIVFNRHLPYFQWLQQEFAQVERLIGSRDFVVAQARQPRLRRDRLA